MLRLGRQVLYSVEQLREWLADPNRRPSPVRSK
jgi:hypothetical protein